MEINNPSHRHRHHHRGGPSPVTATLSQEYEYHQAPHNENQHQHQHQQRLVFYCSSDHQDGWKGVICASTDDADEDHHSICSTSCGSSSISHGSHSSGSDSSSSSTTTTMNEPVSFSALPPRSTAGRITTPFSLRHENNSDEESHDSDGDVDGGNDGDSDGIDDDDATTVTTVSINNTARAMAVSSHNCSVVSEIPLVPASFQHVYGNLLVSLQRSGTNPDPHPGDYYDCDCDCDCDEFDDCVEYEDDGANNNHDGTNETAPTSYWNPSQETAATTSAAIATDTGTTAAVAVDVAQRKGPPFTLLEIPLEHPAANSDSNFIPNSLSISASEEDGDEVYHEPEMVVFSEGYGNASMATTTTATVTTNTESLPPLLAEAKAADEDDDDAQDDGTAATSSPSRTKDPVEGLDTDSSSDDNEMIAEIDIDIETETEQHSNRTPSGGKQKALATTAGKCLDGSRPDGEHKLRGGCDDDPGLDDATVSTTDTTSMLDSSVAIEGTDTTTLVLSTLENRLREVLDFIETETNADSDHPWKSIQQPRDGFVCGHGSDAEGDDHIKDTTLLEALKTTELLLKERIGSLEEPLETDGWSSSASNDVAVAVDGAVYDHDGKRSGMGTEEPKHGTDSKAEWIFADDSEIEGKEEDENENENDDWTSTLKEGDLPVTTTPEESRLWEEPERQKSPLDDCHPTNQESRETETDLKSPQSFTGPIVIDGDQNEEDSGDETVELSEDHSGTTVARCSTLTEIATAKGTSEGEHSESITTTSKIEEECDVNKEHREIELPTSLSLVVRTEEDKNIGNGNIAQNSSLRIIKENKELVKETVRDAHETTIDSTEKEVDHYNRCPETDGKEEIQTKTNSSAAIASPKEEGQAWKDVEDDRLGLILGTNSDKDKIALLQVDSDREEHPHPRSNTAFSTSSIWTEETYSVSVDETISLGNTNTNDEEDVSYWTEEVTSLATAEELKRAPSVSSSSIWTEESIGTTSADEDEEEINIVGHWSEVTTSVSTVDAEEVLPRTSSGSSVSVWTEETICVSEDEEDLCLKLVANSVPETESPATEFMSEIGNDDYCSRVMLWSTPGDVGTRDSNSESSAGRTNRVLVTQVQFEARKKNRVNDRLRRKLATTNAFNHRQQPPIIVERSTSRRELYDTAALVNVRQLIVKFENKIAATRAAVAAVSNASTPAPASCKSEKTGHRCSASDCIPSNGNCDINDEGHHVAATKDAEFLQNNTCLPTESFLSEKPTVANDASVLPLATADTVAVDDTTANNKSNEPMGQYVERAIELLLRELELDNNDENESICKELPSSPTSSDEWISCFCGLCADPSPPPTATV
eukprot:jgi/Psemu1/357/gm1.357_g